MLPDGNRVLDIGGEFGIRVRDRATGVLVATWLPDTAIRGLALSADGATLLAGADGSHVALRTDTGKLLRRWSCDGNKLGALSADGTLAVLAGESGGLRVCRVSDGRVQAEVAHDQIPTWGAVVDISPDQELACACSDNHLRLWSARSGELLQELALAGACHGCAFVPGQGGLLTWGDKEIALWIAPPRAVKPLAEAEARALIAQLASDSYKQREAATQRLIAAGRPLLPLLQSIRADDAEQAARLALVQKQLLKGADYRTVATLPLNAGGGSTYLSLHPRDGYWALTHGRPPERTILLGRAGGGQLMLLGEFKPPQQPESVAFADGGRLLVGNCNGTISEYGPAAATRPADR